MRKRRNERKNNITNIYRNIIRKEEWPFGAVEKKLVVTRQDLLQGDKKDWRCWINLKNNF